MSTFNVDGVMVDIPGIVIQVDIPDEQLVAEAIALGEAAEATEAEASPSRWGQADRFAELQRRGWSHRRIADDCRTNHTTVGVMCRMVDTYVSTGERPRFWQAYQEHRSDGGRSGNGSQVTNNSGDNEWFTPAQYIEAARTVMGGIDLDPASSPAANEVVRATRIHTVDDDGLAHPWEGRVWMNPPYAAKLIRPFCERLAELYDMGDVTQAVALVNSATETGWFHTLAGQAVAMCFPCRRIKFWHPNKEEADAPLQGQTVFYFGANLQSFRDEFSRFGFTVTL